MSSLLQRQVRIMSYNVNDLPWPLKRNKEPLFQGMEKVFQERKIQKSYPDLLLLQEGFSSTTKNFISRLDYKYVHQGNGALTSNRFEEGSKGMQKAVLGSGLWILSRYPIIASDNLAYGGKRCAGYDCLANKGVSYVRIEIPDVGPMDIFNTHMNCYGASGCPPEVVSKAQNKQLESARKFIEEKNKGEIPIVYAGDFNIKSTDINCDELTGFCEFTHVGHYSEKSPEICDELTRPLDLHVSTDHHLYRDGASLKLLPIYAAKSMREQVQGMALSDHLAYEVVYQFSK